MVYVTVYHLHTAYCTQTTTIINYDKNISSLVSKLNTDLAKVTNGCIHNYLVINPQKPSSLPLILSRKNLV